MSAHNAISDHHGHDDHGHDDGAPHATFKGYMTGFILAFAAVQIVVHMVYFLHMDSKSQHGWTMLAFIFTVVLVVITLSGSLWVMFHMNNNMMPHMTSEAHHKP